MDAEAPTFSPCHKILDGLADGQTQGRTRANLTTPPLKVGA